MTRDTLRNIKDTIRRNISARRITSAIENLEAMVGMANASWEIRRRVAQLREAYEYLTKYALDGIADPQRASVYDNIVAGITDCTDMIIREASIADSSKLYYSTLRYERLNPGTSISSLEADYTAALDRSRLAAFGAVTANVSAHDIDTLERDLFAKVWTTHPLSQEDIDAVNRLMRSVSAGIPVKMLLASALLMGLTEFYDENRLLMLANFYDNNGESSSDTLRMRALTALLIALWIWRGRPRTPKLSARLATLAEARPWRKDVTTVALQLIRTRDTEAIRRTMTDDIIPSMMKIRPDIKRKMRDNNMTADNMVDPETGDMNPEWEEMLDKSGISDKLKRLSELQESGGDVMMATFANLKNFPFFNEMASWFMTFDESNPAVADIMNSNGGDTLTRLLAASSFICDSDKFSMLLSLASVPADKRAMMLTAIEQQNINVNELTALLIDNDGKNRELAVTHYVQDLYRFFKLFRRKGDFNDPFAGNINPAEIDLPGGVFNDEDTIRLLAEFYFSHRHFDDALPLFERLGLLQTPDAQLYQKMGYCHQASGRIKDALRMYEQAELLDGNAAWLLRRLATCHRKTGNRDKALHYYRRLAEIQPDNNGVTLRIADILTENGRYDEALKLYFKAEYLSDSNSSKISRAIGWASMLNGDYSQAKSYFARIPKDEINHSDLLNMGHLAMMTSRFREALDFYSRSLESNPEGKGGFTKEFQNDLRHLRSAGVDDMMTGIVLDRLLA